MPKTISYEWVVETVNRETEDVEDMDFSEKVPTKPLEPQQDLALVRDIFKRGESRSWAYVKDGKLPLYFRDAYERITARVPAAFRAQFERSIHASK